MFPIELQELREEGIPAMDVDETNRFIALLDVGIACAERFCSDADDDSHFEVSAVSICLKQEIFDQHLDG